MKSCMRILSLIILTAVLAAGCGCYNTCTLKKRSERRDGASFTAAIKGMNAPSETK
jgi:hypothetical protein